ncbi:MAG: sorbosone dehydrogenase [Conexibacter sp.]|nr:sorbosone dehydrogenase [Conexibacter sp.]
MSAITADVRTYGHLIGGEEKPVEQLIDRVSPGTGQLVARFADGTVADAQQAIAAARAAFDDGPWRHTTGAERSRILLDLAAAIRERREQLALLDAEEVGKPIHLARGDIDGTIGHFEYAAALAQQLHGDVHTNLGPNYTGLTMREPVGVAGLIVPWNFPALIYSQKVPYALAAGCAVVVKPSEFTSSTAIEMTRLAAEVGVPAGVINVVTGYGMPVGQTLVDSPDVDFVSFTGSTATGQRVATGAAKTTKRVSLELGGKGATIVFEDADLDDAIDGALFAVFFNTGQCCVSGSRLLVQESIADEFLARLTRRAKELHVGPPTDEDARLGALIHEQHAEKVLGLIESAKQEGATLLTGGRRLEGELSDGVFVEPTIIDGVRPDMRVFREEIFGPVLCAIRFRDAEEAIALANDTTYGLANAVWTKNIDTAMRLSHALRSGTVWVNTTIDGGPQLPIGGVKGSGYGREAGQAGLEEFTELKGCLIHTGKRVPYYG